MSHFVSLFRWVCVGLLAGPGLLSAQTRMLDEFESTTNWNFIQSDGVNLRLNTETGLHGNAIRFDYDFTKGTGYGGVQKFFPIDLPENYAFSFSLKADSPGNNFEIKFIDSTGNNVWWVNNRNYTFPGEWKKIRIKNRHIQFAWGPTSDQRLKRIDRIEFTIASFVGGKGTIWLDDLQFEALPPETFVFPEPRVTASSLESGYAPELVADKNPDTWWKSKSTKAQFLQLDFTQKREFGGLHIRWEPGFAAVSFAVYLSDDGLSWTKAGQVSGNQSNISFLRFTESEARYLKISFTDQPQQTAFGIRELRLQDVRSTLTLNDFLIDAAKHDQPGNYPAYFLDKATYWTLSGVNNDVKEALINEYGMVEAEKARFSIEPMLKTGDSLFTWNTCKTTQSMGTSTTPNQLDFRPAVRWECGDIQLETMLSTAGEANKSAYLKVMYSLTNLGNTEQNLDFFLLIRPFQVNPWYQFLNLSGGAGKINHIRETNGYIRVDEHTVHTSGPLSAFGAAAFNEGNIVELIRNGKMPVKKEVTDTTGLASGVMKFSIRLKPGENLRFPVIIPFYDNDSLRQEIAAGRLFHGRNDTEDFWKEKTGHVRFKLPASADRLINTYRSNLAYILVNRDHAGIQPGSRSYERSWIRDGALTSSALLKSGIVEEVRDFIDWYSAHLYENGKVPCVVDFRGPDPVPENDSHGELIYLIREYFNFTKDTAFLKEKNEIVLKVVAYLEHLIAERSTDYYRKGNDSLRSLYGLVPESISHEGYSAKPMHSYWDNFFTMKGLKDAAEIQKILGNSTDYTRIARLRDTFRDNLYASINLAMKNHHIDYIPGCAELGDFDATSTTIALTPCNELKNLPKPQVYNTFDRYYTFFRERREGNLKWENYTPYENRLIGSFVLLDQPERAHELIRFFLDDQRPKGWNHWAEVVWRDYRTPRYIGDMPHTWVGSDFINAFRSLFVYENEYDQTLVLGAALAQDWIDSPDGMFVDNLPTYYGTISYSIRKHAESYTFMIRGKADLPANGIQIRNFNGSKMPRSVRINGKEITGFSKNQIPVPTLPAEVEIRY